MVGEYQVIIQGQSHSVVVSDETEALLAAAAAGKASVGLWREGSGQDWSMVRYLAESTEALSREYLEQVVLRHLGLPWVITKTRRLVIRECTERDGPELLAEPEPEKGGQAFSSQECLREYIRCQYGFYGYGIWAVTDKGSGKIVGRAGVTNLTGQWEQEGKSQALELGYRIFGPYRRQGLALEACRGILQWYESHMADCPLYAKIDASNQASVKVAKALGFTLKDRKCIESGQWLHLYGWNC